MTMTRAEFLRSLIGTGIGAVMFVSACGGDDGGSAGSDAAGSGSGSNVCTTPTNAIASNHGHVLLISVEDVNAAAAKSYDIMGSATHTHMLAVSAANFTSIKNGQTLNLTTSTTGHSHNITIMCVS